MVYECMHIVYQMFTVAESTQPNSYLYSSAVNNAQDQNLFSKTLEDDIFSSFQLPCLF